ARPAGHPAGVLPAFLLQAFPTRTEPLPLLAGILVQPVRLPVPLLARMAVVTVERVEPCPTTSYCDLSQARVHPIDLDIAEKPVVLVEVLHAGRVDEHHLAPLHHDSHCLGGFVEATGPALGC